jgi:hypothetical protein
MNRPDLIRKHTRFLEETRDGLHPLIRDEVVAKAEQAF